MGPDEKKHIHSGQEPVDYSSAGDLGVFKAGKKLKDGGIDFADHSKLASDPNTWLDLQRIMLENQEDFVLNTPCINNPLPGFNERYDHRFATLFANSSKSSHNTLLRCKFALNEKLCSALEQEEQKLGRIPNPEEVFQIALKLEDGALSRFAGGALNEYNAAYYRCDDAFDTQLDQNGESKAPGAVFVINKPLVQALSRYIQEEVSKKEIKLKELSSGARLERWPSFLGELSSDCSMDITLSDYCRAALPEDLSALESEQVSFSTCTEDLLQGLRVLPEKERFDVMLATFSFDSVWAKEDKHYLKAEGKWYSASFRLKIADWHPRREEFLRRYQSGQPLECTEVQDFKGIFIEQVYHPIDINKEPYGELIKARADVEGIRELGINFPGGLLSTIEDAFARQLSKDGVFIFGETGQFISQLQFHSKPFETSGAAAKYKMQDYYLAKEILEQKGFEVEVLPIKDLVERQLGPKWARNAKNIEIDSIEEAYDSHCVCLVRRAGI